MLTTILQGDCRQILPTLPAASVHAVITSPPYWALRSYLAEEHPLKPLEIGNERTPPEYIASIVAVFRELRRVLRDDGVAWLNLGDTYASDYKGSGGTGNGTLAGYGNGQTAETAKRAQRRQQREKPKYFVPDVPPKNLVGIPWRVALALQADGWFLRRDIIWHKPNPMPESVEDRPTTAHEHVFMLAKAPRYYYDGEAICEPYARDYGEKLRQVGSKKRMANPGAAGRGGGGQWDRDWDPERYARYLHPNGRNKRSVWTVPTHAFTGAHFATMPPELIVPALLSSTSQKGCCPTCGAPWVRQVEKYRTLDGERCDDVPPMRNTDLGAPSGTQGVGHHRTGSVTVTTDWAASCACNAGEPVPCTVLDPFGGAMTTALQAVRHGRQAIAIELNPDYVPMGERRLRADRPLFNQVEVSHG